MSAQPRPRITPEEYLELDRAAEYRSEYYNGEMFAMAGGTNNHALLIGATYAAIRPVARARGCRVYVSEMRLRVQSGRLHAYPDVMVICGNPVFIDTRDDTVTNPVLIVEVLSKSTEALDRGLKSTQYRTIETLREYVIVSQWEPRVEVFRRRSAQEWLMTEYAGLDAVCALESLECQIPLAAIFEDVEFAAASTEVFPT
jgi:Uma2 family endonuclease